MPTPISRLDLNTNLHPSPAQRTSSSSRLAPRFACVSAPVAVGVAQAARVMASPSSDSEPVWSGSSGGSGHAAGPSAPVSKPRGWALQNLPADVWRRLEPHSQRTLLFQGQILHEAGASVERVYFPNSGMVSMVLTSASNEQVEVAMAGREGAVGALEMLSDTPSTETAVVQVPGTALWLPASVVRDEFQRGGAFAEWMLRFWASLAAQKSQAALCNRLHSVEERLCRWLLGLRDRVENDEIEITHGSIAQMLGARRSGVTVALGALGAQGLLDTGRGHIMLLDIEGLRASSCACHATLSRSFDALRSA